MIDLAKIICDWLHEPRGHRTNIIGALEANEFRAVQRTLALLGKKADGRWQSLARLLKDARRRSSSSPFAMLTEPEWVQFCNFVAGRLVNTVAEFNRPLWAELTGTQATKGPDGRPQLV